MARKPPSEAAQSMEAAATAPDPAASIALLERIFWWPVVLGPLLLLAAALNVGAPGASARTTIAVLGAILAAGALLGRFAARAPFDEARRRHRAFREAKVLLNEARRILRKHATKLKPDVAAQMKQRHEGLEEALASRSVAQVTTQMGELDELIDEHLPRARKSTGREYGESIGVAIGIALLVRWVGIEAFKIPSGSMIPTLEVGDHIFVNKFAYGLWNPIAQEELWTYRKPHRGDVVVFKFPVEPDKDFIKRIIAVEGDKVEISGGQVMVNGVALPRKLVGSERYADISDEIQPSRIEVRTALRYLETLDGKQYEIFRSSDQLLDGTGCPPPGEASFGCDGPVEVPAGHVFVMGDNRENSHDSRFWGFVPDRYIKGKALFIWYSGDPTRPPFVGARFERFFHGVN